MSESPLIIQRSRNTIEVQASLPQALANGNNGTGRVPLKFPGPTEIVGCYPSVIAGSSNGGLLIPGLDDILVLLDINDEERATSRLDQTAAGNERAAFVTLGALGAARAQRNLGMRLENASPELGIEFRWKRPWDGAARYEDAIVSLAFFTKKLEVSR